MNTLVWDDTEWLREDMLNAADDYEEMTVLTKQIDALEQRELKRAILLWRSTAKLWQDATTKPTPAWVMKAIEKLLVKCEQQIQALGGDVPYDL